ncbi:MAG: APC family permease, partial [Anaerolineales bacterium]
GGIVRYDPKWQFKLLINGLGATVTAIVMVVFAIAKFTQGAWVIVLLIPTLVMIFFRIHHHYKDVAHALSLEAYGAPPRVRRNRVLLLIGGVHRSMLHALRYARSLSDDVTAVFVATDPVEAEKVKQKWQTWGDGIRLVMIDSPYRRLIEPLLEYIDTLADERQPHEILTIVVPQFVPTHWWQRALHMNTARILRDALLRKRDIVVMDVPYHIDD